MTWDCRVGIKGVLIDLLIEIHHTCRCD